VNPGPFSFVMGRLNGRLAYGYQYTPRDGWPRRSVDQDMEGDAEAITQSRL
jgi:hypothetical protein